MEINTAKTKIIVFNSSLLEPDLFYINGNILEQVEEAHFLGLNFKKSGISNHMHIDRIQKSSSSQNAVLFRTKSLDLNLQIYTRLFDSLISSILLYGCEIWGYLPTFNIDNVQIQFFRKLFCIRNACPSLAIYGEFGRYPLSVSVKLRMLKYWFKIVHVYPRCAAQSVVYHYMKTTGGNEFPWINKIRSILTYDLNAENVWLCQTGVNSKQFLGFAKRCLLRKFKNEWFPNMAIYPSMDLYIQYKTNFGPDNYFNVLKNKRHLCCYIRFRLRSHNLEIERGRYTQPITPREARFCQKCNSRTEIDDEYHFLLCCSKFNTLRNNFLPAEIVNNPSRQSLVLLLKSENHVTIRGVAKFLYFSNCC